MRLTAAELEHLSLPELTYILDGLIPTGLTLLTGKPKSGKSWFVLQLALAVARGGSFLGRRIEPGDVLYFASEDRHRRLKTRLRTLMGAAPHPHNLILSFESPTIGAALTYELREWVRTARRPRLVIIDTLGRAMPPGGAADPYGFTTRALAPLHDAALETDLAVVLVHHNRKGEGADGDPFDSIHGSTAYMGVADSTLVLQRRRHTQEATLHVTGRDINEDAIAVRFDAGPEPWSLAKPDPLAHLSPERLEVYTAFAAGPSTPKKIGESIGKERSTVANHVAALKEEGLLIKLRSGLYTLPENAPKPPTPVTTDAADDADAEVGSRDPEPIRASELPTRIH